MTLLRRICRLPLLGYFALTYGIRWGGILVVLAATGFDPAVLRPLDTGLIFVSTILGPSIAGLTMTALLNGRAGLRELSLRLLPATRVGCSCCFLPRRSNKAWPGKAPWLRRCGWWWPAS